MEHTSPKLPGLGPFDIDVLIAFADTDNVASNERNVGWVSQFKKFLEFMISKVSRESTKVLLKGEYDSMTSPRLDNVALLVTILSKDFTNSSACLGYIDSFSKLTKSSTNRIFKVFKAPLTVQEQPEQLRELFGYEMYQLDIDSGEFKTYEDYFSPDAECQYWMELVDLSYDICNALLVLRNGPTDKIKKLYKEKTVYIAQTSRDLSVQRNIITRELQLQGYTVLPRQPLPGNIAEVEKVVRQDLNESNLSVHLIGNTYGEIPEGSDQSVVDFQNKIAAEKSLLAKERNENFSRLIWISPNLNYVSERQKTFIETIKRDFEGQEGTEILQNPLEDFKNVLREELIDADDRKTLKETGGRAIYLIHDKMDQSEVNPYIEMLQKLGFNVLMPVFEGELLELRQKHIENLRALDAAIIYKGRVNEQWVRMKVLDLMKAPGFGRKKPIIAKAILAAPGSLKNRETFKNQNFRLIEGDADYTLESLKLFVVEFKG